MLPTGTPIRWTTSLDKAGSVKITVFGVVADVRADGKYVVRFVGKSGRPVQRIARAEHVSAR